MSQSGTTPPAPLPLAGLRILALSSFGAGPWATMLLADLGADVIKIEDRKRGGDTSRAVPPLWSDTPNDSLYFQAMNRNKRSLCLDIRAPAGREIFEQLVARSDAVYNNLRGDQPKKLRITYNDLAAINPRIVCASCSGYGSQTSRAGEPGYDFVVQALTGYMSLTGEPDGPPARAGVSVIDFGGGMLSVLGLLAAVIRARATGCGGDVETSLYEGALSMLNYLAAWNLNLGFEPQRLARSAHQSIVPVQTFPTRDGWIFVMCMKDKFFDELCMKLELGALPKDPRFATIAARFDHQNELLPQLEAVLKTRSTEAWLAHLRPEVPCAPVNDLASALRDPFVAELGALWEVEHPDKGTLREVACPVRLSDTEPLPRRAAPGLGEHSEEILAGLVGLSEDEIRELRDREVI